MNSERDALPGTVSVVIPTLDEAFALPATLDALEGAAGEQAFEVIVVDAGSRDETLDVARTHGCRVVRSPREQRAAQMNMGAAIARGEVVLFLHADTLLPPGALARVLSACAQPDAVEVVSRAATIPGRAGCGSRAGWHGGATVGSGGT